MQTVDDLFARLRDNVRVAGVLRYGSDPALEDYRTGDLDLFVVLADKEPEVESLHFDMGGVPIDLNLLTLSALQGLEPGFTFPALALRDSVVVFDRSGAVGEAVNRFQANFAAFCPPALSSYEVAFMRHGHRHALDKLRNRLETEPLLARVLLDTNVYWLLQSYFRLRQLPFAGERRALGYLREHEPALYGQLNAFYRTDDLAEKVSLTEAMTARVLEPVGGAWQEGEVLAFGRDGPEPDGGLTQAGLNVYWKLFGNEPNHGLPGGEHR